MYDANYTNSHFELKESNIHGHKFAVKTKLSYQEPALDKTFFSLQTARLWNSLPENVVEAPTTDMFKNIFDRHCREIQKIQYKQYSK